MRKDMRSCAGVSLVEAMVAVAVLAVGVLGLARAFTVSASMLDRANRTSVAAILASQRLEELRTSQTALEAVPGEGVDYVDRRGDPLAGGTPSGAAFTRRWWVRADPSDPDHLRLLRVRVTPGSRGGGSFSPAAPEAAGEITLTTIVSVADR